MSNHRVLLCKVPAGQSSRHLRFSTMRRRFVMRRGPDGVSRLVELDLEAPRPPPVAPMVMSDIDPYRSVRTGEAIKGRAQHREHLRQYGLQEIGNEWAAFSAPRADPGPAKGEIAGEIKRQLARDPGERHAEAESVLRGAGYGGPAIDRIIGERPT